MIAAAYDNWVGLGLAVAAIAYLVVVLIHPERF
jgi:K+-transporting ATPase KdpF subunit